MIPIITDSREPAIIAKSLGANIATLPHGDYQFWAANGTCCLIERKTVSDALNSLREGRLQQQLSEMLALENTIAHLLIEGYWSCTNDFYVKWQSGTSGWKLNSFSGHLLTFQHEGVKLILSPNIDATIYLLEALYHYYQKEGHHALSARPKPLWAGDDLRSKQVYLLSALPGVGETLAERILEKFSPVEVLVNPHLLAEVEGIGAKKILEIERLMGLAE